VKLNTNIYCMDTDELRVWPSLTMFTDVELFGVQCYGL